MSTQPQHRYTLQDYFELEATSEERYEYFDGEIFNMSGASPQHEEVISNALTALKNTLRGRGCHVYPSNLRVKVPAYLPYRYPDLTALCDEPQFEKIGGIDALVNPSLIVEVLSHSTGNYDRGDKFTYYKSIESFREYLLIAQHRAHITHFSKDENGTWAYEEINDLEGFVHLSSLDCELSLRDVYENIEFPPSPLPPPERPDEDER